MSLRYRCLVIDHDDTAVDSTATIHYPAHVEAMRIMRPGHPVISLEEFLRKSFDPGILAYYKCELGMSDDEIEIEFKIWEEFAAQRIPRFYDGFLEVLKEHRGRGGVVAVVSHSYKELIERDYLSAGEFVPDVIFGWDFDENKRKPNPFPIYEILKTFRLKPEDVLVVDDMKPGILMARSAGVEVAAAGWAYRIPEIEEYMRSNCVEYFSTVKSFRSFIFGS